ncbi:MAG: acetylornithine deacetylase/succinyl-diaminopimelate desuccinylase family protein [Alphaproteobacteria bacterium]
MRDRLLKALEAKRDALVALTVELIQFPTINPPGDAYTPCAEYIGNRLGPQSFEVTYVRGHDTPGDSDKYPRTNIIARREGSRPGPVVHFNGHIDVVAVGEGWSLDPFAGVVKNGRVYGRGSCDMKGGLAAAIIAVETLFETVPDLPGAVEISGTVDEETGGYGGVAYLAGKGFFSPPKVDHVIIPEPLNVDRVCLGHRGVWWGEVETHGRIAHGSMPFLGDSAIRHMGAVLARIEAELYPALAARTTTMPVVPEGAKASTLNINSIHGGLGEEFDGWPAALVADRCRLVLDRRFLIEEPLDQVRREIYDLLEALKRERPNFDYTLRELWAVEPTMTDENAAVVRAVAAEINTVLGRPAQMVISPGTYDQKHVARIGHLKDCIAYGPGILDLAHQPDEYVGIDDMMAASAVMATAAYRLLTGGEMV